MNLDGDRDRLLSELFLCGMRFDSSALRQINEFMTLADLDTIRESNKMQHKVLLDILINKYRQDHRDRLVDEEAITKRAIRFAMQPENQDYTKLYTRKDFVKPLRCGSVTVRVRIICLHTNDEFKSTKDDLMTKYPVKYCKDQDLIIIPCFVVNGKVKRNEVYYSVKQAMEARNHSSSNLYSDFIKENDAKLISRLSSDEYSDAFDEFSEVVRTGIQWCNDTKLNESGNAVEKEILHRYYGEHEQKYLIGYDELTINKAISDIGLAMSVLREFYGFSFEECGLLYQSARFVSIAEDAVSLLGRWLNWYIDRLAKELVLFESGILYNAIVEPPMTHRPIGIYIV